MLIRQLCIWFRIDTPCSSRSIDVDPIKVLNFNFFQLVLTGYLRVILSLKEFAIWMLWVLRNCNGVGHRSTIISLNPSFGEGLFLFLFIISVRNCSKYHAFSLHYEVVIHRLFIALRAIQVFTCVLGYIFRWLANWNVNASHAYSWLFEVMFGHFCVSFFGNAF